MGQLILILGGARSGKSTYAQQLAQALGQEQVLFVATAEAGDEEMAQRIAAHRQERPAAWRTLETPRQVGAGVRTHLGEARVVLVDCLTLLVSNIIVPLERPADLLAATAAVDAEVDALLQVCQDHNITCIVVSNEVGLGLVPDTPLGRMYRDLLGRANQRLAAQAQAVYFMVAGLAIDVKALTRRPPTPPSTP
jgi:adenosylcobinamide kinase/adenosylcobinamide-phosphate guanylyltransferase